jgi:hypothetical protein
MVQAGLSASNFTHNQTMLTEMCSSAKLGYIYNYNHSSHYPSSRLLFEICHFGDWILYPCSGELRPTDRTSPYFRTETELSHRNFVFTKNTTKSNIQHCDSYINIPSSQTYRSYWLRTPARPHVTGRESLSEDERTGKGVDRQKDPYRFYWNWVSWDSIP